MVLPVRIDWSTLRVVDLIEDSLMSAGTLSPTVDRKNKAQKTLEYLFTIYKHLQMALTSCRRIFCTIEQFGEIL